MVIVLDNAESILDSEGKDAQEIYTAVEELSHFKNIWLCITSRVTTIPPNCEALKIPTLSMDAARDTFYRIYRHGERSDPVCEILERLDFHPLSVTLLATVAQHNGWDTGRLTKEWERRRTGVLHAKHKGSLADTIELSLASPSFQELSPDARDLLGVVAFFPQGVNEDNLNWLFPTIPNRTSVFDTFCILSLTYRSNGFVTMLAPLREHLCPKDPRSSPLLCMTKENYFHRLSVEVYPGKPGYDEAQWITSEDVNVEHLLDVFTTIDASSREVWTACHHFMEHLAWHKRRLTVLGEKIKELPDDHPSKAKCLPRLAWLFHNAGNYVESKQLLIHALKLWREQEDGFWLAETLWSLSRVNRSLGLSKEGVQQVKEALGIYERLGDIWGQARSLRMLALLLKKDGQLGAAEGVASEVIDRFPGRGEQFEVCECHRVLGEVCESKGETEKAINYLKVALGIASSFNWDFQLLWIHFTLAQLFFNEDKFDDAHTHIERAKSHAVNNPYHLGRAVAQQAWFWYRQRKLEEARSAASDAVDIYERLGATKDVVDCRNFLQMVERATERGV
jgi:tetratricopeptide (TPR) repeat protein